MVGDQFAPATLAMKLALPVLLQLATGLLGTDPYVRTRVESNLESIRWPCLWWGDQTIVFNQNELGNPVTGDAAFTAVSKALASWQAVMSSCGSLTLSEGPHVSDRTIGYDARSSNNVNVILFRTRSCSASEVVPASDPCHSAGNCPQPDCWVHDPNAIAITTTSYKVGSGQILDADIELNAATKYFTTVESPRCTSGLSQSCAAWDIQNTMTHEFGHSVGLEHTTYPTSIMTPYSVLGETWKRNIDRDSGQFVCDAYPAGLPPRDCHSQMQGDNQRLFGCSSTAIPGMSWAALLASAAWLLDRGKRSRRKVVENVDEKN